MLKKPDHWLVEHITKSVAASIVATVVISILIAAGLWFLGVLQAIWAWLFGSFEISVWHYCLILVVLPVLSFIAGAGVIVWFARRIRAQEEAAVQAQPAFLQYQEDLFFGYVWRWSYAPDGAIHWSKLTPYCRKCNRRLLVTQDYDGSHLLCNEHGNKVVTSFDTLKDLVVVEIQLKIKTNTFSAATAPTLV